MAIQFSEEYQEHYRAVVRLNKLYDQGLLTLDEVTDAILPHIIEMARLRKEEIEE